MKNVLGVAFILAGVAMLVLPGQGLGTILIGVILLDFPRKFAFDRWLIRRRPVHRAMNWIRTKAGRAPLQIPSARGQRPSAPILRAAKGETMKQELEPVPGQLALREKCYVRSAFSLPTAVLEVAERFFRANFAWP